MVLLQPLRQSRHGYGYDYGYDYGYGDPGIAGVRTPHSCHHTTESLGCPCSDTNHMAS